MLNPSDVLLDDSVEAELKVGGGVGGKWLGGGFSSTTASRPN